MWFKNNMKPSVIYGTAFASINHSLRYMSSDLKYVIDPVIRRNGFFRHTENVLISMLVDDRTHIRQLDHQTILKVREVKRCFETVTILMNNK